MVALTRPTFILSFILTNILISSGSTIPLTERSDGDISEVESVPPSSELTCPFGTGAACGSMCCGNDYLCVIDSNGNLGCCELGLFC
ncbi:hypothetical protein H2248_001525 [Termitomyces sp. 'cryptogamus']|nr:hypothetical protein H2248_001525 [Termitomyces sp. 'cryptogamus']